MDLKGKPNEGTKPVLRLDISNPSYKYITAKAAKAATGRKAQAMRVFSIAKWAEGGIETILDYTKTVYKDRGLDYKEDGFPNSSFKYGNISSNTSCFIFVVAALSKYFILISYLSFPFSPNFI